MSEETEYTGAVYAGGPVDVRELGGLTVAKLAVGRMSNNAYLLRDRATGRGLLIDAADEADKLLQLVTLGANSDGASIDGVLTTHRHADHWQSLAAVVEATGAATSAGSLDAPELPVPVDHRLNHGDVLDLGESHFEIIGLRGHTPGSVALLYRDESDSGRPHLFTGDSLFPGGVGKTWSSEDFDSLLTDVTARIFGTLPDETWFYPGHGDDSTLGAERPDLAGWRERGW